MTDLNETIDLGLSLSDEEPDDSEDDLEPEVYLSFKDPDVFANSRVQLKLGINHIGRDPSSCNVSLNSDAVSKQHAVIEVAKNYVFLFDSGSRNGTRRNSVRLTANVRYEVVDGDALVFGDVDASLQVFNRCRILVPDSQPASSSKNVTDFSLLSEDGSMLSPINSSMKRIKSTVRCIVQDSLLATDSDISCAEDDNEAIGGLFTQTYSPIFKPEKNLKEKSEDDDDDDLLLSSQPVDPKYGQATAKNFCHLPLTQIYSGEGCQNQTQMIDANPKVFKDQLSVPTQVFESNSLDSANILSLQTQVFVGEEQAAPLDSTRMFDDDHDDDEPPSKTRKLGHSLMLREQPNLSSSASTQILVPEKPLESSDVAVEDLEPTQKLESVKSVKFLSPVEQNTSSVFAPPVAVSKRSSILKTDKRDFRESSNEEMIDLAEDYVDSRTQLFTADKEITDSLINEENNKNEGKENLVPSKTLDDLNNNDDETQCVLATVCLKKYDEKYLNESRVASFIANKFDHNPQLFNAETQVVSNDFKKLEKDTEIDFKIGKQTSDDDEVTQDFEGNDVKSDSPRLDGESNQSITMLTDNTTNYDELVTKSPNKEKVSADFLTERTEAVCSTGAVGSSQKSHDEFYDSYDCLPLTTPTKSKPRDDADPESQYFDADSDTPRRTNSISVPSVASTMIPVKKEPNKKKVRKSLVAEEAVDTGHSLATPLEKDETPSLSVRVSEDQKFSSTIGEETEESLNESDPENHSIVDVFDLRGLSDTESSSRTTTTEVNEDSDMETTIRGNEAEGSTETRVAAQKPSDNLDSEEKTETCQLTDTNTNNNYEKSLDSEVPIHDDTRESTEQKEMRTDDETTPPRPDRVEQASGDPAQWNCPFCTFLNHVEIQECEMCLSPRVYKKTRRSEIFPQSPLGPSISFSPSSSKSRGFSKENERDGVNGNCNNKEKPQASEAKVFPQTVTRQKSTRSRKKILAGEGEEAGGCIDVHEKVSKTHVRRDSEASTDCETVDKASKSSLRPRKDKETVAGRKPRGRPRKDAQKVKVETSECENDAVSVTSSSSVPSSPSSVSSVASTGSSEVGLRRSNRRKTIAAVFEEASTSAVDQKKIKKTRSRLTIVAEDAKEEEEETPVKKKRGAKTSK